MDKFFDRLGDLLLSLRDLGRGSRSSGYYDLGDPDMRAAIEELDEYLKSGGFASGGFASGGHGGGESGDPGHGQRSGENRGTSGAAREALRRDYATLEVAFASPLSEVRRSYKRLLNKYHPDRFSSDADKQALATEVTQRLNQAFERIEKDHRGRSL